MLAILDIGHRGVPGSLHKRGARHQGFVEADLTPVYAAHAALALIELGHSAQMWPTTAMSYEYRHAEAMRLGRQQKVAYVQCHLNANTGDDDYAATFYRADQPNRRQCADDVADALKREFSAGPIKRSLSIVCHPAPHWTSRPLFTLSGFDAPPRGMAAICFEPCFLDNVDHHAMLTPGGLKRVGLALAAGLHVWATT